MPLTSNVEDEASMKIGDFNIVNSECEKRLSLIKSLLLTGVYLAICKNYSQKINALARVAKYMSISNCRILMNAFFKSQFNSCPLVWMCHSRIDNMKINRLHERYLRIVYNDKTSSFKNLLEKDDSISILNRNLQVLATEIFKTKRGISSSIMKGIFEPQAEHPYNLRCISQVSEPLVSTVFHGTESISFLRPKIWTLLP